MPDSKVSTPQPLIDGLLSPGDLRKFSAKDLLRLADEIRFRIKETVSNHGGHLASNLGVVELTIALHRVFDFSSDRLLWDVGHQAYVHKLLTGRAKNFHTNRQSGGISGFPDPKESIYDIAKVGHSSTAISTGVGVAEGYRKQGQRRKTVVVIGDGALTGGMSFEGLINGGDLKSDLLIVLNDNGNFIDAPVGSLHTHLDRIRTGRLYNHLRERILNILRKMPYGGSLEKTAEHLELAAHRLVSPGYMFEDLGFRYFGPVDGHDEQATEDMLRRVSEFREPVFIHVLTKKGGGWQPSSDDPLTFHGPKGFDLDTGAFHPKPPTGKTYSNIFAEEVRALMDEDDKVVAVTAAMPSGTGLRAISKDLPDRVYDVGICEQHSFAFVQGLATSGMRPILAHYSTFAQRGYDQLFQEVVVQRDLGLVITFDRAGLVGEDGETHHGLYDIGWSRCLPGLVLMAPKDGDELRAMLRWTHTERQGTERAAGYIIRYPKDEVPLTAWPTAATTEIAIGKAEVLQRGSGSVMIWAYGASVYQSWLALQAMGGDASQVTLVNARFCKPFDDDLLVELTASHQQILTVEDHALPGGFGAALAERVVDLGLPVRVKRLGVSDELIGHASRNQQLRDQGIDAAGIQVEIRRLLGLESSSVIPFRRRG